MENSHAEEAILTCPHCNQVTYVDIWLIVDALERPDLLNRILTKRLHEVSCDSCEQVIEKVDAPLLVFQRNAKPTLVFSEKTQASDAETQEHAQELIELLRMKVGDLWQDSWIENILSIKRERLPEFLKENEQAIKHIQGLAYLFSQLPEEMKPQMHAIFQQASMSEEPEKLLMQLLESNPSLQRVFMSVSNTVEPSTPPVSLIDILQELSQPPQSRRDLSRRVTQCRQGIARASEIGDAELWADLQHELAKNLAINPEGDPAHNIELAIEACQLALEVRTRHAFPEGWAAIQNSLAKAHTIRIRGDRADNMETAIEKYRLALEVRTRQMLPEEWADTQYSLASAYSDRIRGDRADNIEVAIKTFNLASEVYTRQASPEDWTNIQNNLANTYVKRIRGDRADNIEIAIEKYRLALEVQTRKTSPESWALTQRNLAVAYLKRSYGDRAENIEVAIEAYRLALEVYSRQVFPHDWASIQGDLANAYSDRIHGDRADNIEIAIEAYKLALEVRTRETSPEAWADTQHNLAIAYLRRTRGDHADNIEAAIKACRLALEVRTRETSPEAWAATQNNLATVYLDRTHGNRADNVEAAVEAYLLTLEVYSRQAFPSNCRQTARSLADLYADESRWSEAIWAYTTAISASEDLYQSAVFKGSQDAELENNNDLYRRAAYAYAQLDRNENAVALLEQGRARGLREALERDRADMSTIEQQNSSLYNRYQTAAEQLQFLEKQERTGGSGDTTQQQVQLASLRSQATKARADLKAAIAEIRQIPGYENFLALPDFASIKSRLRPNQTLVYVVATPNGGLALIVHKSATGNTQITKVPLNNFSEADLKALIDFNHPNRWFGAYNNFRQDSGRYFPAWQQTIQTCCQQLQNTVMQPITAALQFQSITTAALIPCGLLSFFPLHALTDAIHFTYAPSALSLAIACAEATQIQASSILAINNPTKDLINSEKEVTMAIAQFPKTQTLMHEQSTRQAVLDDLPHYSVIHFSCHGSADTNSPLDSFLAMHGENNLTLRDFFNTPLNGIRLAVLSACETGLSGTTLPDEAISLPTGLLQAGVAGVISTLWSVADFSTALLLTKFYDLWRKENHEPAAALHHAQRWLRDSTQQDMIAYLKSSQSKGTVPVATAEYFRVKLSGYCKSSDCPFSHPFFWAAFTYTGA